MPHTGGTTSSMHRLAPCRAHDFLKISLHTQSATHHSQLMHRRVQHSKEYRVPAETALRVAIFIHTATLMAPRARWCFSLGGTLLLANFGESLHMTTRVSDHNNSTNTKDSPAQPKTPKTQQNTTAAKLPPKTLSCSELEYFLVDPRKRRFGEGQPKKAQIPQEL